MADYDDESDYDDEDVYDDNGVEEAVEDDEISVEEEAFMKGYNKAGKYKKSSEEEEEEL